MKKLATFLVVYLLGFTGVNAESSISFNPQMCGNFNVHYVDIGNRTVVIKYTCNWPSNQEKEVTYRASGFSGIEDGSLGSVLGGQHFAIIQYVDALSEGYWKDFHISFHAAGDPDFTNSILITTEENPVLQMEILSIENTSTGSLINYGLHSTTLYGGNNGWGAYFFCDNQKIVIIPEITTPTGVITLDTVWCIPGIATNFSGSYLYTGTGGEVCMTAHMKVLSSHPNNEAIVETEPQCFDVEGGQISTGFETLESESVVSIFPNPSEGGDVYITSKSPIRKWQVYDVTGKLEQEGGGYTINASGLISGMYVVRVQDVNGKEFTERMIRK